MKRFVLSALAVALAASCAFGAVKDFGEFTLDIPQGWTAELSDEDTQPGFYTVNIEKTDKSSLMLFSYGQTYGAAIEDMVEDWANMEEDSSKPKRTSDGYYMFTYKNGEGKKATVYARSESGGKIYVSAEMIGKDMQTMTAIRNSFALRNTRQ